MSEIELQPGEELVHVTCDHIEITLDEKSEHEYYWPQDGQTRPTWLVCCKECGEVFRVRKKLGPSLKKFKKWSTNTGNDPSDYTRVMKGELDG